jgi:hypothetical protein
VHSLVQAVLQKQSRMLLKRVCARMLALVTQALHWVSPLQLPRQLRMLAQDDEFAQVL